MMRKKILVLSIIMCCAALLSQAQQAVGQWQLYPTKISTAGTIYEGVDDEVYYLSGNNLFSYNKNTFEISSYNSGNSLSDNNIKNIYYNYENGYLLIVYASSNIDILFADDYVVNMPDLKNTLMMSSKEINDVTFAGNKVYLATDFGVVILNDEKYEVYESYIYNKVIQRIGKVGKNLIALIDNKFYIAQDKPGLFDFNSSWKHFDLGGIKSEDIKYFFVLDDNHFLVACDGNTYVIDVEEKSVTLQDINCYASNGITKLYEGYLIYTGDKLTFLQAEISDDNQLQRSREFVLTDNQVMNGNYSSYNAKEDVWCSNSLGITKFRTSEGVYTLLVRPSNYNTSRVEKPQNLQIHKNKLYVKNMGPYNYSVDMTTLTDISTYDLNTSMWSVFSPDYVIKGADPNSKGRLRSSFNLAFESENSDVFYTGSWFDGLHKFDGTTYVGNYNINNSPLSKPWSMLASFSDIDNDGNLWTIMVDNKLGDNSILACLPADKKALDPTEVTSSDWITYDVKAKLSYWNYLLVCKKSPYVLVIHGAQVSNTRLTVVNRLTGQSRLFFTFTDQDGGSFGNGVLNFLTAEEDNNGNVWIGTTSGPIVLNNINNIMNDNYRCTRVKVPRNDGTNYADYLLEDETINTIVVDGANRKWLGTATTGVYLVNENGSEILEHYSTENSIIPSNMIYDMVMDEKTGMLFVATDLCLASYRSTVSSAASNYDNVTVFPNPVRPDYYGWITIQGLMENSLVKITDVAGNLFTEGYSDGGTFVWDGRTATGERVKTGVYLIYASQSGGQSGVVAKVMVVN